MPKARVWYMTWPSAAAPRETAELGRCPTMMVSTMPMTIQPISARTSGRARCSMGGISRRMD